MNFRLQWALLSNKISNCFDENPTTARTNWTDKNEMKIVHYEEIIIKNKNILKTKCTRTHDRRCIFNMHTYTYLFI